MSLHDKLHSIDEIWDSKYQEREIIADIDARIRNAQSAIAVAQKIVALKFSPGWSSFEKAVEGLRESRRNELEMSMGRDSEMRIVQGRCLELGSVLALMRDTERNLQGLASNLEVLKKARSRHVTEDGKVKPQGMHS